jgi:hypothetical protein
MGKRHIHAVKCWKCKQIVPHCATVQTYVNGRWRHYCVGCDQRFKEGKRNGRPDRRTQ